MGQQSRTTLGGANQRLELIENLEGTTTAAAAAAAALTQKVVEGKKPYE